MPIFTYHGRDAEGVTRTGTVEAGTEKQALRVLQDHHITVTELTYEAGQPKRIFSFRRVTTKDLVVMSRQMATMINAGLPIVEAMRVLADQTENPKLKVVIDKIASDVEGGSRLSIAFGQYPHLFSEFYINLLKSGETTGQLNKAFLYLADEMERNYDLTSQIRGALLYPAFILCGLVVVSVVMMIFVVPQMVQVLTSLGGELPVTTKIFIAVSGFITNYWWIILFLVALLGVSLRYYHATPEGRRTWDRLKLRLPVLGSLFRKIYITRFTSNLSVLLVGDIPIVQAIRIVAALVNNSVYRGILEDTAERVKSGDSMTVELKKSPYVPAMVHHMVAVGERTGELSTILSKVGTFYSREVENEVKGIVALIEPTILIVMGVAVGVLVSAILLPMYNLANTI